jgi:serine/threonine protein kinase
MGMVDRVGQQFGHYQLSRLLGKGGFAEVYLGSHIYLGSEAAIKVILNELSEQDKELFRIEGRTLVRLIHPHIVRLLDFGIENNIPYFVMDYAPNGSLRDRHPHGTRLPLATIVAYVNQVAQALQYAHDQKLIHRDVKPENMLLGHNNDVVLGDFGIAVVAHSTKSMRTEEAIGTVSYMAPEQLQKKPRPASDQYALAIVVYSWLTGTLPFTGTAIEIAMQHLTEPVPPLRTLMPGFPVEIEQVVLKALEKDPEHRYESTQSFAQALEQASQNRIAPTVRENLPRQNQPQPANPFLPQKTKAEWVREGITLYGTQKFTEAIRAYDNAIRLDANYAIAYINRGNAYDALREYQKAIENFDCALFFNPRDATAYYNRGNAFYNLREYQRAIADYDRALAINPNYTKAKNNRAEAYRLLNGK